MGNVLTFKKPKANNKRAKGKTLCKSGFHKWQIDTTTRFDVKVGKLVTRYYCQRCGKTRTEAR